MAVRFILGRSGTGKTHHCVKAIVEALSQPAPIGAEGPDNRPLVLLVPEQATYQASEAILSDLRVTGYNRLHILSFDRLSLSCPRQKYRQARDFTLGRSMVIQRILRDCAGKLTIFADSAKTSRPGAAYRRHDYSVAAICQHP